MKPYSIKIDGEVYELYKSDSARYAQMICTSDGNRFKPIRRHVFRNLNTGEFLEVYVRPNVR